MWSRDLLKVKSCRSSGFHWRVGRLHSISLINQVSDTKTSQGQIILVWQKHAIKNYNNLVACRGCKCSIGFVFFFFVCVRAASGSWGPNPKATNFTPMFKPCLDLCWMRALANLISNDHGIFGRWAHGWRTRPNFKDVTWLNWWCY